jgi:hypothetical protein
MTKIFKYSSGLKNIFLIIIAILLAGVILMLGWINHRDFERSVINAELRELLIIAKSASHDIENRVLPIKQEPQYIDKLIQHINNEELFTTFVMNSSHIILNDHNKGHVGKNILDVGKEVLNTREISELSAFVAKLDSSNSGTAILLFPSKDGMPKKEMKLFAFANLQGQNGPYAIVVTESLSALTGPIHRNLRDILVLVGLFFLVFMILSYVFYHIQKKRIQLETSSRALEIINKQLHCEIDDYRCIERSLNNQNKDGRGGKNKL